jgi:hypothetical protein
MTGAKGPLVMCAEPPLTELRHRLQGLLNAALAKGRAPSGDAGLGPRTMAALAAVADQHPEATPEHIAHAYDMFLTEHGSENG